MLQAIAGCIRQVVAKRAVLAGEGRVFQASSLARLPAVRCVGMTGRPLPDRTLDLHEVGTRLFLMLLICCWRQPAPAAYVEQGDAWAVPRQLLPRPPPPGAVGGGEGGEGRLRSEGHVCRCPPPGAPSVPAAETGSVSQPSTVLLCFDGTDSVCLSSTTLK